MLGGGNQGGSMSDQSSSSSLPSDEPIPSSGLDDEVPF